MLRIVSMLLCAGVAVAVTAAPAPVYKPDRTRWLGLDGWDGPTDPRGDCRFHRVGDKVSIWVPGEGHGGVEAPRLFRGVTGDFALRVRVSGDFSQPHARGRNPVGHRRAGIVLINGDSSLHFGRTHDLDLTWESTLHLATFPPRRRGLRGLRLYLPGPPLPKPLYLRLDRSGDDIWGSHSEDGLEWNKSTGVMVGFSRRLKVGLFAEATAGGSFEVVFDHFSLTQPLK